MFYGRPSILLTPFPEIIKWGKRRRRRGGGGGGGGGHLNYVTGLCHETTAIEEENRYNLFPSPSRKSIPNRLTFSATIHFPQKPEKGDNINLESSFFGTIILPPWVCGKQVEVEDGENFMGGEKKWLTGVKERENGGGRKN